MPMLPKYFRETIIPINVNLFTAVPEGADLLVIIRAYINCIHAFVVQ